MTRRIYLEPNVWDAALDRIRWVFKESPNVYVNVSGGKDSTVLFHLALQVAEEMGRLPLRVFFIDQEAEWASVVEMIHSWMYHPKVTPYWLQVPFLLENSTNSKEQWLRVWEPGAEWLREKDPIAIHENIYGADKFSALFDAFHRTQHPSEMSIALGGVRVEESPARSLGLTTWATYKGETWGRVTDRRRGHYTFYPLYDWALADVWHAIHSNGWPYCRLYDAQYQHGVPVQRMRVSNVHHETAVNSLFYMQEVEPETWARLVRRLGGINTAGQLRMDFLGPKQLPPMFASWAEYRDHLLDNLILDPDNRAHLRAMFAMEERMFEEGTKTWHDLIRMEVACVLVNDKLGTKLKSFRAAHMLELKNRGRLSGRVLDRVAP